MFKSVYMRGFKPALMCCVFSLLFLVSTAFADSGFHVECPKTVTVGEPFIITVKSPHTVEDVVVTWLGKNIPLSGQGTSASLMLPTPLETSEKTLPLLLVSAEDGYRIFSASLKVVQKDFVVQSLKVDSRFVTPPAEVLPRIAEESKKLREIYAGFSQQRHWANSFVRPVPGIITSEFGLKRVFNGEPRSRHKGVDFRAAEGAKIKALAAGTVVFASNTYYSGNLVVIDHGLGVFTSYSHLSATKVKEGQLLEAGQLLGLAGSTGRVTGPHLHLGLIVQGESQTPEPLMPNFRKK